MGEARPSAPPERRRGYSASVLLSESNHQHGPNLFETRRLGIEGFKKVGIDNSEEDRNAVDRQNSGVMPAMPIKSRVEIRTRANGLHYLLSERSAQLADPVAKDNLSPRKPDCQRHARHAEFVVESLDARCAKRHVVMISFHASEY